jgi:hypothetical protein
MAISRTAERVRTVSDFLDGHWVLKWFVVPIWLMASALLLLFLGASTATGLESLQVVGLFVAFSLGVVLVGLAIERVVAVATGFDVLHRKDRRE